MKSKEDASQFVQLFIYNIYIRNLKSSFFKKVIGEEVFTGDDDGEVRRIC